MIKAAGRMGWKPDEFWFSTPSFFYAAFAGHLEQERDRRNAAWEQARVIAWFALHPYPEKKDLRYSDIVRLPWDDETETPRFDPISPEELAAFNALADRGYEQHTGTKWQA